MKILIDANVLYPTVMREVVLGVARVGLFEPRWSARILEEWARAAGRLGPDVEAQARGEIVMLQAAWPQAEIRYLSELEARLWLPDSNDIHVLAAAVSGSVDAIMTANFKDFPRNVLAEEGLIRFGPDNYLKGCAESNITAVFPVASAVLSEARRLSGEDWTMRKLMKKARLPLFGKAIERLSC